ncbi:MAG: hypothetical protein ACREAC_14765, partial [Blastocatellia bacterium]
YRQGSFGARDESLVPSHLTECALCIARFREARDFFGPALPDDEDMTDQHVDRLWEGLRFRLGRGRGPQLDVVAQTNRVIPSGGRWRGGMLLPLAAGLVLALGLGIIWTAQLRNRQRESARQFQSERNTLLAQLNQAEKENGRLRDQAEATKKEYEGKLEGSRKASGGQTGQPGSGAGSNLVSGNGASGLTAAAPELNVLMFDVFPERAVQRAGGAGESLGDWNDIRIPSRAASFVLLLNANGLAADRSYRVDIVNQSNRVIWRGNGLKEDGNGNFRMLLSTSVTVPGTYRLRLYEQSGPGKPVADYKISVKH